MEKVAKNHFKNKADDILNEIYEMPYIIEFCEGILPQEKFMFYKVQDLLYLQEFSKGLYTIGNQSAEHKETFHKWAVGIKKELELLEVRFETILKDAEMSPANLLYTSYLNNCLSENKFYKSLTAFFACFWVYHKVGDYLYKKASKPNPYQEWINFYHSEDFAQDVKMYKSILNKTFQNLEETQIQECVQCFRLTCKMEYKFWESAYNFEFWPLSEIKSQPPHIIALTIAGSDSSGGAGIQADLNTFHAHKVVGCSAITALTAQNSMVVSDILAVSREMTEKQIKSVLEDCQVNGIKIGMIYNKDIAEGIANSLKDLKGVKIVVDPVMVSSTGYSLISIEASQIICQEVLPLAEVVTPNIPETLFLLGNMPENDITSIGTVNEMVRAGKKICEFYKIKAVLVKGGHVRIDNKAVDVLVRSSQEEVEIFEKDYLESKNTHGTGCSLSSAITANLAKGYSLSSAVKVAKNYVYNAVKKGYKLGKGEFGTLNHFT